MFARRALMPMMALLTVVLLFVTLFPVQAGASVLAFQDGFLGVGLTSLPQGTEVVLDQYLSPEYGFTVVDEEGRLLVRVEWLREASPIDLEAFAQGLRESFPTITVSQESVTVGGREGVVLSPIPGQVETAVIFVSANGRLYRIFYNTESDLALKVVRSLTFVLPQGDLSSLGLRQAEDALYDTPPWDWQIDPQKPAEDVLISAFLRQVPQTELLEPLAYTPPGCVNFPTWKFLQTQWAWNANGSGSAYPQGWSKAGPSYFGEGLHVGCNRSTRLNDYFALDHPLKEWDIVYPPAPGTVLYAGWAKGGWAGLGRVVIIDLGNGYWAMAAHLRGVNVHVGQSVGISTVIGWAGGSGYYRDNYWGIHLHQGLYKDAHLASWAGGVYGGHSAQPIRVHYFWNGGGDYWYIRRYQWMSW